MNKHTVLDENWLIENGYKFETKNGRLEVKDSLDLSHTNITELPDNLIVGWGLDISHTKIQELPDSLVVGGGLNLSHTKIKELPEDLVVGGGLYLKHTDITELPDNLVVGGGFDLVDTKITELPDNLIVGGHLDISHTNMKELPNNLVVGRGIYLAFTKITEIPDSLVVGGSLDLRYSSITKLPENLVVGGSLDLSRTNIKELPKNLVVGGHLDIRHTKIKELPANLENSQEERRRIAEEAVESAFNRKGFTFKDGILAKIINDKGNIKKIQIVGQSSTSFIVSDSEGNSAHGKTIKEAQQDLLYKQIKDGFDGDIPDQATGLEWASIYRSITRACQQGIRVFVESTGKDINKEYTKEEILEITKGQYRYDEFFKKIKEEK